MPKDHTILRRIVDVPRQWKVLIVTLVDLALIEISLLAALMLRMSDPWPMRHLEESAALFVVLGVMGTGLALIMRIPQFRLSTFDLRALGRLAVFAVLLAGLGTVLNAVFWLGAPRSVPIILGPVLICALAAVRVTGSAVIRWLSATGEPSVKVAIYGAGSAGMQLVSALSRSAGVRVVAIVDDKPALQGVIMSGLRVASPETLRAMAGQGAVERILLAMPSVPKHRLDQIAWELDELPCDVRVVPAYSDLVTDVAASGPKQNVDTTDLLCRSAVALDMPLIAKSYAGRTVLVAGAGGSIGAELCRQITGFGLHRIVLFEQSEYALYAVDREVRSLAEAAGVEVSTVLGSICDQRRVETVLAQYDVDIVLHAAAYKHVPLVEDNVIEGVRNNVLGTQVLAEAARRAGVERFILISTDKAVRPTNVMGATKRLAEMIVQDLQSRSDTTRFAMVRFGNVLGSSGSVVPLFEQQIAMGGPVTLTHPDVTRYFMTLLEAARLVLTAGSYARGGDLFVLDMGAPVRIMDLARRMIEVSGLSVRDAEHPYGDIEVRVTGLRPGEKLYEELLIGENILETPHPKILRAEEACPSEIEIAGLVRELRAAVEQQAPDAARLVIRRWVEGAGTIDAEPLRAAE